MAEYPTSPKPQYAYTTEAEYKTIITTMDSGKEQRRNKWTYPKFNVHLVYNYLTKTQFNTLYTFYQARKGSYEAFYFYDLVTMDHDSLWVGKGNESTDIFDIPGKGTSAQTIYLNGEAQGSGYSILTGGGAENSDRVDFVTPPSSGVIITCDFNGYLRIRCRFKDDKLSREAFAYAAYRTGIELKGLSFEA
jgi:hypothetical protein